jgi:hypothetical protein
MQADDEASHTLNVVQRRAAVAAWEPPSGEEGQGATLPAA